MSEVQDQPGVSVHAGFPNPAADSRITGLDLNRLLISHTLSTYHFRVRGSEWEHRGIFDGDIALVDRALDPRKTDLVLWQKDGDGLNISPFGSIAESATIWGVVTAVIHQFRKGGR
jgi:DNA polymerase V